MLRLQHETRDVEGNEWLLCPRPCYPRIRRPSLGAPSSTTTSGEVVARVQTRG
jgi:hypothetical protein